MANSDYFDIGTNAGLPKHYGYSVSGIKMDEKIVNGDIRKVLVSARQQYTTNFPVALDLYTDIGYTLNKEQHR